MAVDLFFDRLVLGGSLESLLYSFVTETPIVISTPIVPFELETMDYDEEFKFLGYENKREIYKSEMWDRLSFILSMAGLVMMPNTIKNVRKEDNKLVFTTQGNSRTTVTYNNLMSYDKIDENIMHVYDWFDIKSGSKIALNSIDDNGEFVKRIYFYNSKRVGAKNHSKDLVTYSKINKEEIYDYEKSESFCRLKTIQMMKDAGLRGKPNGYNKRGTALYYAIKLEHTHREVIKHYKPLHTFEQTLSRRRKQGDVWNLAKKLFHHRQISILRESSRLQVKV